MTKKRANEIFRFLASASMKRMTDEEKIGFIRLLRTMKPIIDELGAAATDAFRKASEDGAANAEQLAMQSISDLLTAEADIDIAVMTEDGFDHLALSNDWTFLQIEELKDALVKKQE